MTKRFGEDKCGSAWTFIGFEEFTITARKRRGAREGCLVAPGQQERTTPPMLNCVKFPDYPCQASMNPAGLSLVDVRVTIEAKQSATTVGMEVVVAEFAMRRERVVEAKAVAVFAGDTLIGNHFIKHTNDGRMIKEEL